MSFYLSTYSDLHVNWVVMIKINNITNLRQTSNVTIVVTEFAYRLYGEFEEISFRQSLKMSLFTTSHFITHTCTLCSVDVFSLKQSVSHNLGHSTVFKLVWKLSLLFM